MATATDPGLAASKAGPGPVPADRLYSLDAFRGLTMIWMFSAGFGLHFLGPDSWVAPLARHFTHHEWHGMYAWDLIQPFFMFIVGVAMPFSFQRREAAGEPWSVSLRHVLARCVLLILLGTMARSLRANRPLLDLINVLAQIAFTYFVAFLVLRRGWRVQAVVAGLLLAAHTAFFMLATAPGVTGPWDQNANIGWVLDKMILGKNWGGGYVTINCVSSAANTIFGVMAGSLLLSALPDARKLKLLAGLGLAGIAAGRLLDLALPSIKKIWTASFAIESTGYTLLALAAFYWLMDVKRIRAGASVLVMVGANSIFIYLFHEILERWMNGAGLVFTGWMVTLWGPVGQMLNVWLVVGFQIYVCVWLYRRRIFFKL